MSWWSIPPVVMASITAYVGAYHLLVFFRARRGREHLSFAAMCVAVVIYNVLCAALYNAATPQQGAPWQVWQTLAIGLGGIGFMFFVADYVALASRRVLWILLTAFSPVVISLAPGLQHLLITNEPQVKHISLPLGVEITYNEMAIGPVFTYEGAMSFAVFGYAFLLGSRLYRQGQRDRAVPLVWATALFCVGGVNDALVSQGVYGFIYLSEYAFMALIILMAFAMSGELLRTTAVEEALKESTVTGRQLFDAAGDAIFVHDAATGAILDVNQSMLELYGYTREEALALEIGDVSGGGPFTQKAGELRLTQATETGPQVFEWLARKKSGEEFWVEVALKGAVMAGQKRVLAVVRDISDRKRAEAALRESELFNEHIVGAIPGVVYIFDLLGQSGVYANRNVATLLGYEPEEVAAMGTSLLPQIIHPDDLAMISNLLSRWESVRDEEILTSEYRVRTRDGEWRWWLGRDKVFKRTPDGKVWQIIGSAHDITERRRAELALQESEERYRKLIEASPSGIMMISEEGRVIFANPAAAKMVGLASPESLIGRAVLDFVHPTSLAKVMERLQARLASPEIPEPFVGRVVRLDGEVRDVELVGARVFHSGAPAVLTVGNDITDRIHAEEDRSRLENQLRHAQKMEAVGRLAGGVAHDFNNLLQAILSSAELLASRVWDPQVVSQGLAELSEHARRGARLTRQLLVFSRREATQVETLDLGTVVLGAANLVRRLLRENIRFDVTLANEPLSVRADRSQLEQVVMNLAVNAADAMPAGGTLAVRTGASPDGRCWFEVADTGQGIAEEIRDRIFEPFFTTKESSEGSGLGLSVVHAIVTRYNGQIELDTRLGGGSTFRVSLPRPAEPGAAERTATQSRECTGLTRGEGQRILVIEDEPGARQALVSILAMLGYAVTAVGSVAEARAVPDGEGFAVALSDVILPDGVGNELAVELQRRWPGLAVILMSGYAEDAVVRDAVTLGEVLFLQKPFDMQSLSHELNRALHPGRLA